MALARAEDETAAASKSGKERKRGNKKHPLRAFREKTQEGTRATKNVRRSDKGNRKATDKKGEREAERESERAR